MKFLFDLFPIILFFVAFKLSDIYTATIVAMIATIVQILWVYYKPTALYWLFALTLFISAQFFRKNWIQVLMGKQVTLKTPHAGSIWSKLNTAWALFFFLMGALNLYIAFNYSEETWVNFKLFGSTGLLLVFVIIQGVWLSRHMESTPE